MKKFAALLIIITNICQAQLNLKWGSYITLEHPAINEEHQDYADFGFSLSGIDNDLIIGAPSYILPSSVIEAGAIFRVHSAEVGMVKPLGFSGPNLRYSQLDFNGSTPESSDRFGQSVAVHATGPDTIKVIIGVPFESIGNVSSAGMINEMNYDLFGGPINYAGFHQGMSDINGTANEFDNFGHDVELGDFDGDGSIDAAIGVPFEDITDINGTGAVNIIMGGELGILTTAGDQIWTQATPGINGSLDEDDNFGFALSAGDFNGDGKSDLAIGVPGDSPDSESQAGSVNVLYGSVSGLSATNNQLWNQNSSGVIGSSESGDKFGRSLTSGDFNGDGYDDLAIGVPFESVSNNTAFSAGAVNVLYGSSAGLTAENDLFISQAEPGFGGAAETQDFFGFVLEVGNFNNDPYEDLIIGIPFEDIGDVTDAGSVVIVHGSENGLQFDDEVFLDEGDFNTPTGIAANRRFGWALAAGDFDNDSKDDLAISTYPIENTELSREAVIVAYQFDHDLIFENGME